MPYCKVVNQHAFIRVFKKMNLSNKDVLQHCTEMNAHITAVKTHLSVFLCKVIDSSVGD